MFCTLTLRFGCFFMMSSVYTPAAPDRMAMAIAIIRPTMGVERTWSDPLVSCATVHPSARSISALHWTPDSCFFRNSLCGLCGRGRAVEGPGAGGVRRDCAIKVAVGRLRGGTDRGGGIAAPPEAPGGCGRVTRGSPARAAWPEAPVSLEGFAPRL